MSNIKCATEGCNNTADWIPISVGNRLGVKGKFRCRTCCEAISEALVELGVSPCDGVTVLAHVTY